MKLVSGILLLVIVPTLLTLFIGLFTEWCPWLAERLVRRAARRLPEHARARWEEEWLGDCADLTDDGKRFSTFLLALWLVLGARSMGRILRGQPPLTQALFQQIRLWVMLLSGRVPPGMARIKVEMTRTIGPLKLRMWRRALVPIRRTGEHRSSIDRSDLPDWFARLLTKNAIQADLSSGGCPEELEFGPARERGHAGSVDRTQPPGPE
jgi:hypothetical protein